ncbi:tRNA dimethylallyltransferase [Litoribrevibacter albus]|uniref:tRNA dimethylallyltransferase n=2 Tax=Litoribrevibacter albus TaxID=1473156 RepID=A0AA37S9E3_9GAMM|nr:tRNA dimethylallyltransferase [Litoribrevibacter albus]
MQSVDKYPSIWLMGPTAAGKTDLAVELVQRCNCEIISVDSALIYRKMDIGTAKPEADVLTKAPHRLIDICDPAESYSAAEFRVDALDAMAEIRSAGKVPLLVGGTMMYYKVLKEGIANLPEANEAVRQKLLNEAETLGWQCLHDRLKSIDPVSAERIHPNDPQRLQRALEVYELTGKTLTDLWAEQKRDVQCNFPYRVLSLAVAPKERKVLHERIEQRFRIMLEQGFLDEVKALKERGDLNLNMPSMRSVGYRQVWQYLDGEYDYDDMVNRGIYATRQLAKRQITWLRSWDDLEWLDSLNPNLIPETVRQVQNFIEQ